LEHRHDSGGDEHHLDLVHLLGGDEVVRHHEDGQGEDTAHRARPGGPVRAGREVGKEYAGRESGNGYACQASGNGYGAHMVSSLMNAMFRNGVANPPSGLTPISAWGHHVGTYREMGGATDGHARITAATLMA